MIFFVFLTFRADMGALLTDDNSFDFIPAPWTLLIRVAEDFQIYSIIALNRFGQLD